jgi:acylphosphatase
VSGVARRLVVRGRVQGVGYRHAAVQAAAECGVTGWVRNLGDGSVEAFVQGPHAAVDAFCAWWRRGPPLARVTDVESEATQPDPAFGRFEWRTS